MNPLALKIAIALVAMIVLLLLALLTPNIYSSKLIVSIAIIIGAYSSNQIINIKNKRYGSN